MASLKVKLLARGKSLTPYVAKVSRNGKMQQWFAENIGKPAGACVKSQIGPPGSQTVSQIREIVANCGKQQAGKHVPWTPKSRRFRAD